MTKTKCANTLRFSEGLEGRLSGLSDRFLAERNSFLHFTGLETAGANLDAAHGSVRKTHLDLLEIREKTAMGDSGNLLTDTDCFFSKTAP